MITIAKSLIDTIALAFALPAWLMYQLGSLTLGSAKVFPSWSQAFSIIPGLTGVYLRRAFYRMSLRRCGHSVWIGFGTTLSHPNAEIGDRVYVGEKCTLGEVTIRDDVLIASNVSVINGGKQHGIDRINVVIREQKGAWPRVTIGRDSWIGERTVIMADVGDQAVIGAGAVVTRPIPDHAVACGIPAKVIRYRGLCSTQYVNDSLIPSEARDTR